MSESTGSMRGKVEAISKEGELDAPAGCVWVKVTGHDPVLANVGFLTQIRKGAEVQLQVTQSRHGPAIQEVQEIKEEPKVEAGGVNRETGPLTQTPTKPAPTLTTVNPKSIMSPSFLIRLDPNDIEIADHITASASSRHLDRPPLTGHACREQNCTCDWVYDRDEGTKPANKPTLGDWA